ncbi:hypothetical protein, partial [Shimia abyssi]|uniref:hypothetical protein n=1 Tax=Shimia abyssi TaxID=1662395 RepID=UPI001A9FD3D8
CRLKCRSHAKTGKNAGKDRRASQSAEFPHSLSAKQPRANFAPLMGQCDNSSDIYEPKIQATS